MKVFLLLLLTITLINSKSINKEARIIGGEAARAGQFPFSTALYITTATSKIFCGGALLNNLWILTAGHCIEDALEVTIYLGSNSLTENDPNRITVASNDFLLHPSYNSTTLYNDLGLIRLRIPVQFSDYIGPILLPTTDVFTNASVTSIGWGQTSDTIEGPVDYLNTVGVTTISNDICKLYYGSQIQDTMICVDGNYNEGTCTGDSGTPLVYYLNNSHPVHVGISSFYSGNGCESIEPSGYTRTYIYNDWIQYVTGGLDSEP